MAWMQGRFQCGMLKQSPRFPTWLYSWESIIRLNRHLGFLWGLYMDYTELIQIAIEGLPLSYAPYSKFNVSAALLAEDGRIYHGVNIENAAFTPTVCAERTAFFKAVSEGVRKFRAICISGCHNERLLSAEYLENKDTREWAMPCGVCRQVMREFCNPGEFEIIIARSPQDIKQFKLEELLPESFGPENLDK